MRRPNAAIFLATTITTALLWPSQSQAQTKNERNAPQKTFGVGVMSALNRVTLENPNPNALLLIPIQVSDHFRIEPELGFTSFSTEIVNDETREGTESSNLALRGGLGLLYTQRVSRKTVLMGGARLGAISVKREGSFAGATNLGGGGGATGESQTFKTSQTTLYGTIVTGAEYFLSPSISLGGEFQLTFQRAGELETSGEGVQDNTTESSLSVTTNGLLTLRWYFL